MSEQIVIILKRRLEDLAAYGELDAETRRNALKEELQFYILNFIYHHPEYSKWVMYGGSALRIIHGVDRMSVDLDFEIPHEITDTFLEGLKGEVEKHFFSTYGVESDFLVVKTVSGMGLLLKFNVGDELTFGNVSKQVHVKIDLNHFVAPKTVTEHRPINRDQFSFVVVTYNMSALMASKIAAIFLRRPRGVGNALYEEKGRDIYDLLWYMNKKAVPDFDYLVAKGVDGKDPRALFDKLTLRMNKVSDENLKQDLLPLFTNRTYIENWLKNWRESYFRLLDEYKIRIVTALRNIIVQEDFHTDNFSFTYLYDTQEGEVVRITYQITYEWVKYKELLKIQADKNIIDRIEFESSDEPNEQSKQLATLFYQKTEAYFKKTNRVMVGDAITTKLIRTTVKAENLNLKEQILLDNSALLSCELDDLLK